VGTAATFAGGLSVTGAANYTSGGLTTINTVNPVFTSSGTITANALTLSGVTTNVTTGTTINVTNATTVTGGSLTIDGSGVFNTGSVAASTGAFVVNGASASLTATTTASFSGQLNVTLGTCTVGTTMVATATGSKIYVDGGTLNVNGASATFGNSGATTDSLVVTAGTFNINNIANASIALGAGASVRISGGTINAGGKFGVGTNTNAITYNQTGGDVYVATLGGSNSATLASFDAGTATGTVFSYTGGTLTVCQGQIGAATNLDFRGPNPAATVPPVMGSAVFTQFGTNVIVTPSIMATSNGTSFRISTSTPNAILNATNNPNLVNAVATTILGDLTLNGSGIYSGVPNLTVTGNSAASPGNIVINNTAHIAFTGGSTTFNGSFANQTFTNNGTVPDTLAAISMNKSVGGNDTLILNAPLVQRSSSLALIAGIIRTTATNMFTLMPNVGVTTSSSSSFIDGPMTRYYTSTVAGLASSIASLPIGKSGIGYLPLFLAPTVTPSGSSNIKIVAEVVNDATGSNISPSGSLSNKKWSIQTTEISGSLTNTLMQLKDATVGGITASSMILKSPSLGGTYKSIAPFSTAVANTSVTSASTLTRAEILANPYYSYGLGCYADSILKVLPNICVSVPITLNSSGFVGTWSSASPSNISVTSPAGVATGLILGGNSRLTFTINAPGNVCDGVAIDTTLIVTKCPGGVAGANLWLRSDAISTTIPSVQAPGSTVSLWTDQSGNNRNAVTNIGAVTYQTTASTFINFNPIVKFDGTAALKVINGVVAYGETDNDFTVFTASRMKSIQKGAIVYQDFSSFPPTSSTNRLAIYPNYTGTSDMFYDAAIGAGGGVGSLSGPTVTPLGTPDIVTFKSSTTGPAQFIHTNGAVTFSDNTFTAFQKSITNDLEIGRSPQNLAPSTETPMDGEVAEIIIYNATFDPVGATGVNKIESYLGLKYGITLDQTIPQSYLAGDGVTQMWDASAATSGYNHNIFGIGRDTVSELHQKVSASANARNIVTLETENSFTKSNTDATRTGTLNQNQFLTIADSATTSAPAFGPVGAVITGKGILNNAWEVQNINGVGAVYLQIADSVAAYNLALPANSKLYLVYDNSGSISAGSTVVLLTKSGHFWQTPVPVTFNNLAKFTLASALGPAPGGSAFNLVLWLKADKDVTGTSPITSWVDQTGNNTFSTIGTPQLVTNGINFNPTTGFNGSSYFMGDTKINNFTEAFSVATIANPTGTAGSGAVIGSIGQAGKNYFFHTEGGTFYSSDFTNFVSTSAFGNNIPYSILNVDLSQTPNANQKVNVNGYAYNNEWAGDPVPFSDTPVIGSRKNISFLAGSQIAEVIGYNGSKSGIPRQQIISYLGLKYGITLSQAIAQNYVASDSTIFWNATTASPGFNKNIFGIGKDTTSALDQRASTSINLPQFLDIATTNDFVNPNGDVSRTSLSHLNFDVIADNGGNNSATIEDTLLVVNRKWQVQEKGTVGTVYIQFDVDNSAFDIPSNTASQHYLIYDADGDDDYSNATVIPMTRNGSLWSTSVDFASMSKFGIAYNGPFAGNDTTLACGATQVSIQGSLPNTGTWAVAGSPAGVSVANGVSGAAVVTVPVGIASYQMVYTVGALTDTMVINTTVCPGGVTAGLWLKADAGITLSGTNVTTWTDQTANALPYASIMSANDFTGVPAALPKFLSADVNYNPTIDYTARYYSELSDITHAPYIANSSLFAVGSPHNIDDYSTGFGSDLFGYNTVTGYVVADGGNYYDINYDYFYGGTTNFPYINSPSKHTIFNASFPSGAGTAKFSQNGGASDNLGMSPINAAAKYKYFGGYNDVSGFEWGKLSEVIVMNTNSLTANEIQRVNSYLAIKYGISLAVSAANYANSAATNIYDIDGTYKNNIIAIGRDDASGLAQKQSHTAKSGWSSDSLRLFVSTGGNAGTNADLKTTNALNTVALTSNQSFVVIGDDGLDQNSSGAVGMPAGIIARLNKTWKLTNTGFTQPFTLEIVLPAGVPLANISDLRLICNTAAGTSTPSALGSGSTVIAGGANGITFGSGSIIMSVDPSAGGSPFAAGNTAIFTIGSVANGTLPLNLLGFEAKVNGAQVATQWTVSNEQDVKGYEVQRSANSINGWLTVATQNAAGNSTGSRTYSGADNNPLSGTSYYRLKINDHNGRIIYSDIRKVQFSATAIVRITPNPTSGSITIKAPAGELRSVSIVDATGKPVKQIRGNAGDTQLSVDLSNLAKGVYIIKTQTTSQKVIVK
jgi:hypothetical protein